MLKVTLIRHGQTEGNKVSRYIGVTDEPLCPEGREALQDIRHEKPEILFVSPLKRCRETASILFPDVPQTIIQNLSECDFGEFENKNYKELADNPHYQQWVDSGGTLPFPGGESKEGFAERSVNAFADCIQTCSKNNITNIAFVVHGGTIMCIMEHYARPARPFYEWHVTNAHGYTVALPESDIGLDIRFTSIKKI